jgi:hypothetical protein
MEADIRNAIWLDANQVKEHYRIKRSTLDRRVMEGKVVVSEDKRYGAKKGTKRYLHDSVKQYIASLGNGLDKKPDQNYRYNTEKRHPFPTFLISKPDIYAAIELV